jgi:hypothetical protein
MRSLFIPHLINFCRLSWWCDSWIIKVIPNRVVKTEAKFFYQKEIHYSGWSGYRSLYELLMLNRKLCLNLFSIPVLCNWHCLRRFGFVQRIRNAIKRHAEQYKLWVESAWLLYTVVIIPPFYCFLPHEEHFSNTQIPWRNASWFAYQPES